MNSIAHEVIPVDAPFAPMGFVVMITEEGPFEGLRAAFTKITHSEAGSDKFTYDYCIPEEDEGKLDPEQTVQFEYALSAILENIIKSATYGCT